MLPTGITAGGDWLVTPGNPPVSVTRSFDTASGDLLVTLTFKLPPTALPMTDADIPFPTPTFSALTAASGWFVANGWHRQTYYAISDGFRLRSDLGTRVIDPLNAAYATNPPCEPEPTAPACIRVDTGPAQARAVLVLAGRHLAGGTRTYTIDNYFELKNADVPFNHRCARESGLRAPAAHGRFQRSRRRGVEGAPRAVIRFPHPLRRSVRGFTLAELAIAFLVISLLLGGMLMTLSAQNQTRQIAETQRTMENARDALLGFAVRFGRLPCPAMDGGLGGEEARRADAIRPARSAPSPPRIARACCRRSRSASARPIVRATSSTPGATGCATR